MISKQNQLKDKHSKTNEGQTIKANQKENTGRGQRSDSSGTKTIMKLVVHFSLEILETRRKISRCIKLLIESKHNKTKIDTVNQVYYT
jgi:hypothetical protein